MTTVLIVDDEPGIRDSLAELFEDAGYSTMSAADGGAALELLRGERLPDIVLLDLLMPVLNGNEVYAAMQADRRLAGIPVIITTSDPSLAPSGLLIMKKPINVKRLISTVAQQTEKLAEKM